jgi:hypothetical protein
MSDIIKTFIRNTNKRLVQIVEELGLTMKITSYVASTALPPSKKTITPPWHILQKH